MFRIIVPETVAYMSVFQAVGCFIELPHYEKNMYSLSEIRSLIPLLVLLKFLTIPLRQRNKKLNENYKKNKTDTWTPK